MFSIQSLELDRLSVAFDSSSQCAICALHQDPIQCQDHVILHSDCWMLRHHSNPAPLLGWLLLDTVRHCAGPWEFTDREMADWGRALKDACDLVRRRTGCDRVYTIAFGEGAPHLHVHLIPRFGRDAATTAWKVADLYRDVASGSRDAASPQAVLEFVKQARSEFH